MNNKFAYGVDLGWVSQLEAQGMGWIDDDGKKIDPIRAAREKGADSVRLRIFVNPPKDSYWTKKDGTRCMLGFCDPESVLAVTKRVKAQGMRLMLDFHYSDHFADPQYQDKPAAWEHDSDEKLAERVLIHTREVLYLFRDAGITPEWVQVGNEINTGLLLPNGDAKEHPATLVNFLNRGYDAVKAVFPNCAVITHVAGLPMTEWTGPFLDNFFSRGGKTDILGLSHYPYWFKNFTDNDPGETAESIQKYLEWYKTKYGKPILIAEIGEADDAPDASYQLLFNSIQALHELPEEKGIGIFYWEPEVNRTLLPDQYPLGAAELVDEKTLRYTKALDAYKDYQQKERNSK